MPRLAKETQGYERVFISNHSNYINPNTKRLVWEYNPFVDGFVDDDGMYPQFGEVSEGKNILDAVSDFYGFSDTGIRFQEPEVYYKPKLIPELSNVILLDNNSFSHRGIPSCIELEKYLKANGIIVTHQMKSLYGNVRLEGLKEISANSLEHLCDIIYSCKQFYGVLTGSITLASALRKPSTVFYVDGALSMFRYSKLHNYIRL